jgi:hypothetical protein
MGVCPIDPTACLAPVIDAAAGAAGRVTGNVLADMMASGAEWVFRELAGWWINIDSTTATASSSVEIAGMVRPIAISVAVGGIFWQACRMMLSRRSEPLINIARGLGTFAGFSAVGLLGVNLALTAGDTLAVYFLNAGTDGKAAVRFAQLGLLTGMRSPGIVMVLGLVMMLFGLMQAVLMLFREVALVILSGLVLVAAAGNFSQASRPWISKWLARMLALVLYKPMAGLIFWAAFRTVGTATDLHAVLVGMAMLGMSIFSLPVMIRFFDWAIPASSSHHGGGMGALAGLAAAGMYMQAARGGGGGADPVAQAGTVARDLGPTTARGAGAAGGAAMMAGVGVAVAAVQAAGSVMRVGGSEMHRGGGQ